MSIAETQRPKWLTFDCYGTLIQWDEGLIAAVRSILAKQPGANIDPNAFTAIFDRYEHALEQERPHKSFKAVTAASLERAMAELKLNYRPGDDELLTSSISKMPPFPEVVPALELCIVSNTDDAIIAGNVAQLGVHVDRVVTAEQAQAYKPSRQIFAYAHLQLGVTKDDVVHICASPTSITPQRATWVSAASGSTVAPAGSCCGITALTQPFRPLIACQSISRKSVGVDRDADGFAQWPIRPTPAPIPSNFSFSDNYGRTANSEMPCCTFAHPGEEWPSSFVAANSSCRIT